MKNEEIHEKKEKAYRLASEYDKKYGSCPQCVLAAVNDVLGIGNDDIVQAAHALAGGGGLQLGGTCGALAGGIVAISTVHGRERKDFGKKRCLRSYVLAKKLYDRFVEIYGSPTCEDVQRKLFGRTFDFWDEEEAKQYSEQKTDDTCPDVAGNVAKWTVEILLEDSKQLL